MFNRPSHNSTCAYTHDYLSSFFFKIFSKLIWYRQQLSWGYNTISMTKPDVKLYQRWIRQVILWLELSQADLTCKNLYSISNCNVIMLRSGSSNDRIYMKTAAIEFFLLFIDKSSIINRRFDRQTFFLSSMSLVVLILLTKREIFIQIIRHRSCTKIIMKGFFQLIERCLSKQNLLFFFINDIMYSGMIIAAYKSKYAAFFWQEIIVYIEWENCFQWWVHPRKMWVERILYRFINRTNIPFSKRVFSECPHITTRRDLF